MAIVIYALLILIGVLAIFAAVLLMIELLVVNRLTETNKQLIILVAGQNQKPEALRALVASAKPPQGKLQGIADGKKKDKKPANVNYTLEVGTR